MTDVPGPREAWDFEAFVRHYNAFARQLGGWNFHHPDFKEESLRRYYESPIYVSLSDFARIRYKLDQEM